MKEHQRPLAKSPSCTSTQQLALTLRFLGGVNESFPWASKWLSLLFMPWSWGVWLGPCGAQWVFREVNIFLSPSNSI